MKELTARPTEGAQPCLPHDSHQAEARPGARATSATGETLVRVIAARFMEAEAASRVISRMKARLDLGPDDVGIAPLGGADQPQGAQVLLAGRFRETRLDEIRAIIERNGGEIVADLDEGRTKSRMTSSPAVPQARSPWRGSPHLAEG